MEKQQMAVSRLLLSPDQFICRTHVKGKNIIQVFSESGIPVGKRYLESSSQQELCQPGFIHEYSFIPASNEPSGRACTASWRMPRGSNTKVSEGHFLLCSVASLIHALVRIIRNDDDPVSFCIEVIQYIVIPNRL